MAHTGSKIAYLGAYLQQALRAADKLCLEIASSYDARVAIAIDLASLWLGMLPKPNAIR